MGHTRLHNSSVSESFALYDKIYSFKDKVTDGLISAREVSNVCNCDHSLVLRVLRACDAIERENLNAINKKIQAAY